MQVDAEPPPGGGVLVNNEASSGGSTDMLIVDGLLCSIVKAQTRTINDSELVEAIDRDIDDCEVSASWYKLFNYFSDAVDENSKKLIKDIKRQSVKAMIEDLVKFLRMKDKYLDFNMLVVPWSYTLWPFITDSEKMGTTWQKESVVDMEKRISNIENRFSKKQDELITQLHNWSQSLVNLVKPGASVFPGTPLYNTGYNVPPRASPEVLNGPSFGNISFPTTRPAYSTSDFPPLPPQGSSNNLSVPIKSSMFRNRIGSANKRPRIDNDKDASKSHENRKNFIMGTANSATSGRKMKSPPVDIFIWGVHKDTTPEDIIADLAESGIAVEAKISRGNQKMMQLYSRLGSVLQQLTFKKL